LQEFFRFWSQPAIVDELPEIANAAAKVTVNPYAAATIPCNS